ncbi:MAG: poly-beta-1,6 N-acetyl-D-glucosamine export porin PgaA [Desulfuromonadales bacterium]
MPRLLARLVVVIVFFLLPLYSWAQHADLDQAIALARAGQTQQALDILDALYTANPNDMKVFHDYLTVLCWSGQDARVAVLSTRLSPLAAPGYALEAAAQSARRRGDYIMAESFYRAGLQRFPDDPDFAVGLVLTLVDAGNTEAALELVAQLKQKDSLQTDLSLAECYALEARRDYFAALLNYNQILDREPTNREARKRRILTLDRLGASDLAVTLASQEPDLLTRDEWRLIRSNQAAFAVRWGNLPPADETRRFAQTDLALDLLERNRAELETDGQPGPLALRARFDRLVAQHNRYQMAAVVEEYQELVAEGVVIPDYVLSAAADAYLYLQQPEQAEPLYRSILATQPGDLNAGIGLFYTLIELEEFDAAYQLIDQIDQNQLIWLQTSLPNGRRSIRPNPDKTKTATAAAMARFYGEQNAEAQDRLTVLHEQAPANLDITRELGNVYAARGWPRQAQKTYEMGLRVDHRHKDLQLGLAQSYLERREYRLAEQAINRLYELYPEDVHVSRLQRQWLIHNQRELRLAAGYADNSGAVEGTRDKLFEGMLFSQPLDYNYRIFISTRYAFADFPEGDENSWRYGTGVEYRNPDLEAVAELTYNVDGGRELGGRLSLLYELDDHWSIPFNLEIFSRDTPLRALKQEITADAVDFGINYKFSELRRASLRAQFMDFSDGNFRRSLAGSLEQRLVTLPKYKLTGIVDLYTSANSKNDTIYFNPERDFSAALTLVNQQRLYRRYDRVFSHRLALTFGNYWQKDYGDDYIAGISYEQIWDIAERFELVYGYSRFRRVYDGDSEHQNDYYTRINWRF